MVNLTPLASLTTEAVQVARAFTVGEILPRLVPSRAALPLHVMAVEEVVGGTATEVLRPCFLMDIGMPGGYVRIPLIQPEGEAPRLGAAELWQAAAPQPLTSNGVAADAYVTLFEEMSAA